MRSRIRRGHKYLIVVVDYDTGRLVWGKARHDRATLQEFFDLLGAERASNIELISADAAEWIGDTALAACENATLCLDPFLICRWGWAPIPMFTTVRWRPSRPQRSKPRSGSVKPRPNSQTKLAMSTLTLTWVSGWHLITPDDWPDDLPRVVLEAVRSAPSINDYERVDELNLDDLRATGRPPPD